MKLMKILLRFLKIGPMIILIIVWVWPWRLVAALARCIYCLSILVVDGMDCAASAWELTR